jgi:hypothetical protein
MVGTSVSYEHTICTLYGLIARRLPRLEVHGLSMGDCLTSYEAEHFEELIMPTWGE